VGKTGETRSKEEKRARGRATILSSLGRTNLKKLNGVQPLRGRRGGMRGKKKTEEKLSFRKSQAGVTLEDAPTLYPRGEKTRVTGPPKYKCTLNKRENHYPERAGNKWVKS